MELSASSIPFKSKKPLLSTTTTPKKSPAPESAVATPEKSNPPPRIRNQNFALSLSDVRRTALQLRKPGFVGSDLSEKLPVKDARAEKPKASHKSAPSLPEKYEMLCEFFGAMVNSIRLFRLKRLSSTFTKLCRNIESLTDRRFSLHHLAQLKHLMPEVIMVKKIRVQDEETNCMKEELLVTLELDTLELDKNAKGTVGFSHLKGIFRTRIADYSAIHPEADNVPEGELPYLFYKGKQDPEPSMKETPPPVAVSHVSPSFKRRFSSKLSALVPESSPAKQLSPSLLETPIKEAASTKVEDESFSTIMDIASTPAKLASTPAKLASTPAELASTPAQLMAATPALRPPKRSLTSPDLPTKSAKRRSLRFDESHGDIEDEPSQVGDDESNVPFQGSTDTSDVLSVLPEDLIHSLMEKDRKIKEEQDPVVSQARRRQQLMAGVPKLFDMIHLLFQSTGRSVFTKEELIYKVVAGHLDVIDRKEVEEQLKLLQEVAPEYISEQSCPDRAILLRRNKASCPDSIRAKLLQAN